MCDRQHTAGKSGRMEVVNRIGQGLNPVLSAVNGAAQKAREAAECCRQRRIKKPFNGNCNGLSPGSIKSIYGFCGVEKEIIKVKIPGIEHYLAKKLKKFAKNRFQVPVIYTRCIFFVLFFTL
jgi:hypothetical protein